MRIIAINSLREYWEKHPETQQPLSEWYLKVSRAEWESFNDMRADFNSVDYVGNQQYVFNIKGSNHRVVVAVKFTATGENTPKKLEIDPAIVLAL